MKFSRLTHLAAIAALVFGMTFVAQAQNDNSKMSSSSKASLDPADKSFMEKAAQGGKAEVELGQLAVQKGQSDDVKKFGQRMVDDHTKANQELQSIASQKGVTLPDKLDAKDQATKDRLSKLSGEQFDAAYINDMVRDHRKDVAEFQHESKAAKDPDLKKFVQKTTPTLEDHLKQAQQIAPKERREAKAQKTGGK